MRRTSRVLLLAVVALGATVSSREAHACTGPLAYLCRGAGAVAAPANARAIVFRGVYESVDGKGNLVASTKQPTLRLTDADGADVPFSIAAEPSVPLRWLVRPAAPLTAGSSYKLTWDALCAPGDQWRDETADGGTVDLVVPAAAPLPTRLGDVKIFRGPTRGKHAVDPCSASSVSFDAVTVGIRLDLDPSMTPYANVTAQQTTVDGVVIDEPPFRLSMLDSSGDLIASCDPAVHTGIEPGLHKVGFRAVVAGLDTPLIAETEVDFACGSAPAVSSPGADGGVDAGQATGGGGAGSGGGCSVAEPGHERGSWLAAFVGLVGCALVLARRRR